MSTSAEVEGNRGDDGDGGGQPPSGLLDSLSAAWHRWGGHLTLVAMVLIASVLTGNHAAWVRADRAPRLAEDSHMHLARFVSQWQHLRVELTPEHLFWADYYAPLGGWLAALSLEWLGPGIEAVRVGQSVSSGLLALGAGILCLRTWGRSAGLAGAALAGTFPLIWAQLNHVMLELPALGLLAMAVALQPEPGRRRWLMTAGGAVFFGLALLTHKKTAFALAGLSAVLGLRALVFAARFRDRKRRLLLAEVLLYGTGVLLFLPWLLESRDLVGQTLWAVDQDNTEPLPSKLLLGMAAWFKHAFLTPLHAWALLAGAVLLPLAVRASPLVLPTLGTAVGMLGIFRFPQIHERYWLPLVPVLLLLMLVPTGLIARSRRPGRLWTGARALAVGCHLALVPAGLASQLLWQAPERLPSLTVGEHYGSFDVLHPELPVDETLPALLAPPTRWAWAVAPPRDRVGNYAALADEISRLWPPPEAAVATREERLGALPGPGETVPVFEEGSPEVWMVGAIARVDFLRVELAMRDLTGVRVVEVGSREGQERLGSGLCSGSPRCLVVTSERLPDGRAADEVMEGLGFELMGRVAPYLVSRGSVTEAWIWEPSGG